MGINAEEIKLKNDFKRNINKKTIIKMGLYLSFLLSLKQDKFGWIAVSREEIKEAIGISISGQNEYISSLKRLQLLETKISGVPTCTHYKLNFEKLRTVLE